MLLGARTGAALSGGAALSASLRIVTQASENNGVGHSSARSDAPSNAITASHCRRESRQQRKQRHFNPKIATRLGDGFVCRRDAGAPPLQERERWWNRRETNHYERSYFGPEECIVRVIGPTFRDENRAGEADDENEGCENSIPRVDRRDPGGGGGAHAAPHHHEFRT